jgi:HK97 family phage prohead protease
MKRKFFNIEHKSLQELGATTHKELWEKVKAQGYDGLAISVETVLTKDADNKFHAVFSTADEDRHRDIVEQNWDLKFYKKNPVYLDSHNYDSIENIIGRVSSIKVKDGILQGDIEFALDNPKGLLAFKLAEGGFLNASSVGFIPKEFSEEGNIAKSELLEISAVSVPANAHALFEKQETETETKQEAVEPEETIEEPPAAEPEPAEPPQENPEPEPVQSTEPEPATPAVDPQKIVANAVTHVAQEAEAARQRRLSQLNNVLRAVRALGEIPKVETRHPADRAKEKRLLNSVIRQLIKQK